MIRRKKPVLRKLLIVLSFTLLLNACGGSAQPGMEIVLDAADFIYSPASVKIPVGEPVMLTLRNTGAVEHDFVIEKIDANIDMVQDRGSDAHHEHGAEANYDLHFSAQPGETSTIQLTVSEPGNYTFYCSVPGHKEAGMLGELFVVA